MVEITKGEKWLSHHGVLGMHWGRHLPGRTEASHNPKPAHPDHQEVADLRKKPRSHLSTSELQKVNKRLQAEQQNRQLDPGKVSQGKKIVLGLVAAGGTGATIIGLSKGPVGKAVIAGGKAFLGPYLKGNGRHIAVTAIKVGAHVKV